MSKFSWVCMNHTNENPVENSVIYKNPKRFNGCDFIGFSWDMQACMKTHENLLVHGYTLLEFHECFGYFITQLNSEIPWY